MRAQYLPSWKAIEHLRYPAGVLQRVLAALLRLAQVPEFHRAPKFALIPGGKGLIECLRFVSN